MTSQPFFQKTFLLRRTGVAIFADIIKFVTMFIKATLKGSKQVRRNRNYVPKCESMNLYLYFLIQQNLDISGKKMLMSAEIKVCVTRFIQFLDLLQVRYNCVKFHHFRICATDFREGGLFALPPIREQHRKRPS